MSNKAAVFLEQIRPYLLVKKTAADLAISFQRERQGMKGGLEITTEIIARRDWYKQEISSLALGFRTI